MGLRQKSGGTISLGGKRVGINRLADATELGIAYLPEDRKDAGLTLNMSIVDNTTLVSLHRYSHVLLDRDAQKRATQEHALRLQLRAARFNRRRLDVVGRQPAEGPAGEVARDLSEGADRG